MYKYVNLDTNCDNQRSTENLNFNAILESSLSNLKKLLTVIVESVVSFVTPWDVKLRVCQPAECVGFLWHHLDRGNDEPLSYLTEGIVMSGVGVDVGLLQESGV